MFRSRFVVGLITIGVTVLGTGIVGAQNYPNKPVRLITQRIGGSSDFAARLIAQAITAPLGQPVIVDNRVPLASFEAGAKATPDGYTMLYVGSAFMFGPLVQKSWYDPLKDFTPITIVSKAFNIVTVHPSLPVKSIKDLIALAKAKPGTLNYFSASAFGSSALAAELFNSMAGVKIVRIAYGSTVGGATSLLNGEVQVSFSDPATVAPHVKSGALRGLAITSPEPSSSFPDLPTVAASGLPGYEMVTIDALVAPVGTPSAAITRLNQEIVRALNSAEMKERLLSVGVEASSSSPDQLAAKMKSDITTMSKVIKEAGIKAD